MLFGCFAMGIRRMNSLENNKLIVVLLEDCVYSISRETFLFMLKSRISSIKINNSPRRRRKKKRNNLKIQSGKVFCCMLLLLEVFHLTVFHLTFFPRCNSLRLLFRIHILYPLHNSFLIEIFPSEYGFLFHHFSFIFIYIVCDLAKISAMTTGNQFGQYQFRHFINLIFNFQISFCN